MAAVLERVTMYEIQLSDLLNRMFLQRLCTSYLIRLLMLCLPPPPPLFFFLSPSVKSQQRRAVSGLQSAVLALVNITPFWEMDSK